jgi:hypothetical protein
MHRMDWERHACGFANEGWPMVKGCASALVTAIVAIAVLVTILVLLGG